MRKVEFLSKMPDPFLKADGTRMSAEEWKAERQKIKDFVVDHEYGGMPPMPEVVDFELLNYPSGRHTPLWYKITAGTKEKQLSFTLKMTVPEIKEPTHPDLIFFGNESFPVLLTGDGCYDGMSAEVSKEANRRGYIAAAFNRLEICKDKRAVEPDWKKGGLHEIYPDYPDFSAISAWAWGYSAVMTAFEKMPFVNAGEVGITGHSRGGKTVMLAAACDERIKYACPNNSGCHGAVSYRTVVTGQGEGNARTERLADMLDAFPSWMGKKLAAYRDREGELPYDMHYFGALIAPRYYFQCEGMQDYWINPIGSWQNFMAVKECYRYLGCEDNASAWFRPGYHRHELPDYTEFMEFMDRMRAGLPSAEHWNINPYPQIDKNFDW